MRVKKPVAVGVPLETGAVDTLPVKVPPPSQVPLNIPVTTLSVPFHVEKPALPVKL